MATEMIDHPTLTRLVEAGAVRGAHVIGQSGGWGVVIKYGMVERVLAAQRSREVRLFRKFETLVTYLKSVGIARFDVDAVGYDPDTMKTSRARPDQSEAMKRAHEAAGYDKWFREQVQRGLDDPRPRIPNEQVKADFAGRRAALRKRIVTGKGNNG